MKAIFNIKKQPDGSGCSTALEHTPCNWEVGHSYPARCCPFSSLSDVSLIKQHDSDGSVLKLFGSFCIYLLQRRKFKTFVRCFAPSPIVHCHSHFFPGFVLLLLFSSSAFQGPKSTLASKPKQGLVNNNLINQIDWQLPQPVIRASVSRFVPMGART